MKIKLPDIVQDDYHVGGRQDQDLAVPRTLPIADLLWGHEAPDVAVVAASQTPTVGLSLKLTNTFLLVAHIT